jgi:hypothetical protein
MGHAGAVEEEVGGQDEGALVGLPQVAKGLFATVVIGFVGIGFRFVAGRLGQNILGAGHWGIPGAGGRGLCLAGGGLPLGGRLALGLLDGCQ